MKQRLRKNPTDALSKPGFFGKPKGIRQILWERGLWVENKMRRSQSAKEKAQCIIDGVPQLPQLWDMDYQLSNCHAKVGNAKVI